MSFFVGPKGAVRVWDPGVGFDTWAEYFLPQARYAILLDINNALKNAIGTLNRGNVSASDVATVIANLKIMAQYHANAIAFDPNRWVNPQGQQSWQPSNLN